MSTISDELVKKATTRKKAAENLSDASLRGTMKPGLHSDGNGLYLNVSAKGAKSWVYRYRWEGKLRDMGLGSYPVVTLAKAREAATAQRALFHAGTDPIGQRRRLQAAKVAAKDPNRTFGPFAESLITDLESQWRNAKHRAQWRFTLTEYAKSIWTTPLDEIDTEAVLAVLKPIWQTKPETASRVRGRIEKVLDAATAKGLRSGLNPARWRGHLSHLLSKRQKLTRGHHAAMPYDEVSKFIAALRKRDAVSAYALEFLILTAARSGEVLGMTWEELDVKNKLWIVPANRMKAGREHRVPLTDRALAILDAVRPLSVTGDDSQGNEPMGHVFRGARGGGLSVMALTMQMRRMGHGDVTPHGFRSAFRGWAGEVSSFPTWIAETALAHNVGDATERAYSRGDALEKRRVMMESWASYIASKGDRGGAQHEQRWRLSQDRYGCTYQSNRNNQKAPS